MVHLILIDDGTFSAGRRPAYKYRMSQAASQPQPARLNEKALEDLAKNILRAEMIRYGVTYATLAERLTRFGITDNELNLRNKVSRGCSTAVFLMQCLPVLGADWIKIPTLEEGAQKSGAQELAKARPPR